MNPRAWCWREKGPCRHGCYGSSCVIEIMGTGGVTTKRCSCEGTSLKICEVAPSIRPSYCRLQVVRERRHTPAGFSLGVLVFFCTTLCAFVIGFFIGQGLK